MFQYFNFFYNIILKKSYQLSVYGYLYNFIEKLIVEFEYYGD